MRIIALFSWITDRILHMPGATALALVFLLPALEASAFVGFVFPGEIAILMGGVLASHGTIPLPAAMAAAMLGAFLGDMTRYLIGQRWGRQILHGSIGRLPFIRHELHKYLNSAEAFLERRGGPAVFVGRFTVALRVLVPGLAGMSKLRFRTFALFNALGAIIWGGGFVLLGYFAGNAWRVVERDAKWAGTAVFALIVLGTIAGHILRKRSGKPTIDLEAELGLEVTSAAEDVEMPPQTKG